MLQASRNKRSDVLLTSSNQYRARTRARTDEVIIDIQLESSFHRLVYRPEKACYGTLCEVMNNYKGGPILMVFFKPQYTFLQLVLHCLLKKNISVYTIAVTDGNGAEPLPSCRSIPVPTITKGRNIIRNMRLLDPLGGGTYPLDCCVLFDKYGQIKSTISWQCSGCDAATFEQYLIESIQDTDIIM